ncbi:hypothetical protein AALP_AA3G020700 [Arabis alpina]|uniref:Uncharacterized protein n=1 Tax=Arabis alpina TaxID=50452 RepID=A0A087H6G9_ARAAL|nr:hypothetical protein AALP_AA3G020700 [Arabis alpina]
MAISLLSLVHGERNRLILHHKPLLFVFGICKSNFSNKAETWRTYNKEMVDFLVDVWEQEGLYG